MGVLRNIAIAVLAITCFTFVALFGRLPALRNTPIGFLHRLIWQYVPKIVQNADKRFTGGRLTSSFARAGRYLTYEQHPLVLILFLALLTTSASLFLSSAWSILPLHHQVFVPFILLLPYLFTYLCVTSTSSYIKPANHSQYLRLYPFDHTLYYPGRHCRTCIHLKPARSKHCSICRACVSRHDHHCIWVNNCIGRDNYRWFLGLLLSLGALLCYGAGLSYTLLRSRALIDYGTGVGGFIGRIGAALASDARVGGVGLLAGLSAPLAWGLLAYHVYLIWAGTTTNETQKWEELKEDMADGLVFVGKREFPPTSSAGQKVPGIEDMDPLTEWPINSLQAVVRTDNGEVPQPGSASTSAGEVDEAGWTQCWRLGEIDNVYDLGFWDNARDALGVL